MNERVIIQEYKIKALENRTRNVRILLPSDYYITDKSYPVLYMHDGQNLISNSPFSGYSWEVLKTMDKLEDETKGFIVVGIDNGEQKRILEYSPYIPKRAIKYLKIKEKISSNEIQAEADFYGDFIVNQLKPSIDKDFKTKKDRNNTFIAGSSCGGVISIYLGFKYQNIFSVIGAFSPAYQFLAKSIEAYMNEQNISEKMYVYHDMGTKENGLLSFQYIRNMKKFQKKLKEKISETNILMIKDQLALHNEYYWAIRFEYFIKFIFRTKKD
ncbi:MAG: alpha/beta hydrolase [Tenericutes bacterium]|nr:alpha/beta hydrolase [Mycoplasmatota bacterium]